MNKVFKSEIGFVVFLPLVLGVVMAAAIWFTQKQLLPGAGILLFLIVLTLLMLQTSYTVTGTGRLQIKCAAFYRLNIDIKSITKIEKTRSVLSSPALSLNRIEIFYNRFDTVILSPKQQDEFAGILKSINPAIEIKL